MRESLFCKAVRQGLFAEDWQGNLGQRNGGKGMGAKD